MEDVHQEESKNYGHQHDERKEYKKGGNDGDDDVMLGDEFHDEFDDYQEKPKYPHHNPVPLYANAPMLNRLPQKPMPVMYNNFHRPYYSPILYPSYPGSSYVAHPYFMKPLVLNSTVTPLSNSTTALPSNSTAAPSSNSSSSDSLKSSSFRLMRQRNAG
jgi:hypothetical protein